MLSSYTRVRHMKSDSTSGPGASVRGIRAGTLALFLAFGLAASATPITYNLTDLGTLGGATASANAVNNSGQTAGTMTNVYGDSRAMASTTNITPAGATNAFGASINGAGNIAGSTIINDQARATVWTNGAAQYLGTLGGSDAFATGINDAGQVTGMSVTASGFGHAFLNTAGVMSDLGVLRGGDWSSGYGVNASGQVAGYGNIANGSFRGFVWNSDGGLTQIGTLGGRNSYAMAINVFGQVTGNAQLASGYNHAFLWSGSGMMDLGTLGGSLSYGYGINDSGYVVGYSTTASGLNTHAFIYENGAMRDLNSLIAQAAGWELTAAYGISGNGMISGAGLFNGIEHAFVLTPLFTAPDVRASAVVPEPMTVTMVGLGAALIAFAKRKSKAERMKLLRAKQSRSE
jgi:probable HAF family extracellular repeat protein